MTDALLAALRTVKTIIVHDSCADGTASALLLHDVLPAAEIKFVQYGTEAHRTLAPTEGMLFCDFSPHESTAKSFVDAGAIVLDHHKTAKDIVLAFGERGVFGDEKAEPGVCGAVLAYRHVWRPLMLEQYEEQRPTGDAATRFNPFFKNAEDFAVTAGIRDTWQKKHPEWRRACVQAEMLRFYPNENWLAKEDVFSPANQEWWRERWSLGELLLAKNERAVTKAIEKSFRFTTTKGTKVAVISGTHLSSDVAEALGDEADLVVGFGYEVESGFAKIICSNRSRGTFDCSKLASRYGGGGHTNAAGYNRSVVSVTSNPYEHIRQLVEDYESIVAT